MDAAQVILSEVRKLLLDKGCIDDPYTNDAALIEKIAIKLGLTVTHDDRGLAERICDAPEGAQ